MNKRSLHSRLTEFFGTEYQKLVRFVSTKIDAASDMEAEDIVQEVAVNLFKRADVGAPIENLSAYVYRSLRNQVIEFFRQRKTTVSLNQPVGDFEGNTLEDLIHTDGPDVRTEREITEIREELHHLLDLLEEEERVLVIATELEGYTFNELALQWQVPINTLLSKKARALKKLSAMAVQVQNQRRE